MAKKGQEIEALYISLGLNIEDLKLGFDAAGKTVSQSLKKLNQENKKIQIKTDVDLAKLQAAGSELDKIKVRYESINRQLDIQKQKEAILQAQLQSYTKNYGKDHDLTARAEMALLSQQKVVAGLQNRLGAVGVEMDKLAPKTTQSFGRMSRAANEARGAVGKLGEGYAFLSSKLATVLAIAATGAGLFNLTKAAMEGGEATYRLTQRLHMTAAEAGQLKRVFSLAGGDINAVTPFIAKLDKQLMSAGEKGNATSKALDKFGISLMDAQGNLLGINDQLARLSEGYKTAQMAGEEEAFTAEVLGAKGAALIPILEQYTDLLEISKGIKTTGLLNPEDAHKTYLEWQKMQMEMGQLKSAMGAALLPLAKEMMPSLVEGLETLVGLVKDNKEGILLLTDALVGMIKTAKEGVDSLTDVFDAVGLNAENIKEIREFINESQKIPEGSMLDKLGFNDTPKSLVEQFWDNRRKEREEKKAATAQKKEKDKAEADAKEKEAAAQRAAKEAELQAQKTAEANKELEESMYSFYHTDLETSLHNIDVSMEKFKEKGASEVEIERATQAQKAKIIKEFNEQVAQSIDSIWKTEYENRLDNIEREKEAWRQKGLDEVKATRWAEEQKRQLQQDTALHMFKENYKYLKLYRKEMASGYGDENEKQQRAMSAIANQMRKDAGLPDNAWTTPGEIAGFQQIMKQAKKNMIPIYDVAPTNFIYRGTEATPLYSPEYEKGMRNMGGAISENIQPAIQNQEVNYNLNVSVTGLEDVGNEVAQTAAKKILERMPNADKYGISYGR